MTISSDYEIDKKAQAYVEGRLSTLQAFRRLVKSGRNAKWFVDHSKSSA